jgi:hypothetical protein
MSAGQTRGERERAAGRPAGCAGSGLVDSHAARNPRGAGARGERGSANRRGDGEAFVRGGPEGERLP